MSWTSLEKCKMRVLFLDFKLKLELNTPQGFSFLDTFRDEYSGNNSDINSTYGFTEYI